jgi:D-sedoheptulose 7-phosphate isomerase
MSFIRINHKEKTMDTVAKYLSLAKETIDLLPTEQINEVIDLLHEARVTQKQIFVLGNGGSASTASHFACDLGKNTNMTGWPLFRVLALTDNMAVFSAYANDDGYENVFSHQLASFIQPDDIVIGISSSGNSENVIRAINLANQTNAKTIGFTGFDGGRLKSLVDINLHVPSDCIELVEDLHLMLEHVITKALRERLQNEIDLKLKVSTTVLEQTC